MANRTLVVVVALTAVLASGARADEWTKTDTAWQAAYSVAHLADMLQTVTIATHPDQFHEHNPILGQHPSTGPVIGYFAGTLVLHTVVSVVLPQPYRRIWQCVTFGFELGVVARNFTLRIGLPL